MKKSKVLLLGLTILTLGINLSSCKPEPKEDPIPVTVAVDGGQVINRSYPEFTVDNNQSAYYLLKVNKSNDTPEYSHYKKSSRSVETDKPVLSDMKIESPYKTPDMVKNFNKNYKIDLIPAVTSREAEDEAPAAEPIKVYKVGDKRDFYYILWEKGQEVTHKGNATLKKVGNKCNIWYLDNCDLAETKNIDYNEVADTFDNKIYKKETNVFGSNVPAKQYNNTIKVTDETKIDILICDIYEIADKDQTGGVYGYFYSADMITDSYFKEQNIEVYTNETEMFCIDSYLLATQKEMTYSILSHEFQHMLCYINKSLNVNGQFTSTWFTEMLSMCAEEILKQDIGTTDYDTAPSGRLHYFCEGPYLGFSSLIWDLAGDIENDNTKIIMGGTYEYANTYAFGTYLMHNYGGVELIHEIATNQYKDEEAITQALSKFSNETFESVLLQFPKVLVNTEKTTDKNIITLNKDVASQTINGISYSLDAIDLNKIKYSYKKTNSAYETLKSLCNNYTLDEEENLIFTGPLMGDVYLACNIYPYGMLPAFVGEKLETGSYSLKSVLPYSQNIIPYVIKK